MSHLHLTIVSATQMEIQPIIEYLDKNTDRIDNNQFQFGDLRIDILISGIGVLAATYSMMEYLSHHQPDRWIQAGIGGAFDTTLEIGKVYRIASEMLMDFGAQEKDGSIISPFDLGWYDRDQFPFSNGFLNNPDTSNDFGIPLASGMTTLYAHGNEEKIKSIAEQPHGQVESMEGAAFFYVSLMKHIPFLSLRAISNFVQPRDKSSWQIEDAVRSLGEAIIRIIQNSRL